MTRFSIATCDELWSRGRLLERRLSHGEAIEDEYGIFATDHRDDELVERCTSAVDAMRICLHDDIRMRLVAEASHSGTTRAIAAMLGERSVITDPEHCERDLALLRDAASPAAIDLPDGRLPVVWRNGSAAVLLHEAFGHPVEHGHDPITWPSWLEIEAPLAMRRASFRDVPLLRMTTLIARQRGAPFDVPADHVEVLFVDGGAYDPLTEVVTIRVGAADLVESGVRRRVRPFSIAVGRYSVARAIAGASGDPTRYPGVVCSREGQEVVVGSWAPLMLTVPLTVPR